MPNAESATLCSATHNRKFRVEGVFTIEMVTVVSKYRFQGKAAVTLEELGLREEEEGRLI